MIIVWDAYPDNGAIGYGLETVLNWTSSIPPGVWTTPTAVHSECGDHAPAHIAARAIDDDTGTYWVHRTMAYHWIIFDFSQTYAITKIRIFQGEEYTRWGEGYGFDVFVSDDPASWGSAVWTGALDAGGWQESGAFNKNGRYIKLVTKSNDGEQRLFEFDAYCGEAAGEEGNMPIVMYDYRRLREA